MIAGLSSSGALQSLYPQYNKKKVSKVKKVNNGSSALEELSPDKEADETSELETTATANYQASVSKETKDLETISYTPGNPYTAAKKSLDSSFLIGMHVDEKA